MRVTWAVWMLLDLHDGVPSLTVDWDDRGRIGRTKIEDRRLRKVIKYYLNETWIPNLERKN